MANRIQLRRDTAANWTSSNPILASGEMGINTDDFTFKIGDGVTAWNSLDYYSSILIDNLTPTQLDDLATKLIPYLINP